MPPLRTLLLLLSSVACAQIVLIPGNQPISQSRTTINNNFLYLDSAKVAKFSGNGIPSTVTASKRGDIYLDLTNGTVYACFAVGPCTAVGLGNWVQISSVGSGITSLNALTAATQVFANDANVTISSASATHTLGWTGLLAVARGGTGAGTLTGVLKGNGTSAFTVVTGTASDCVKVDGTSGPCGSGGGAVTGVAAPLTLTVTTAGCPTCEVTTAKNAASGYAGLNSSSKITRAQGQEVWSLSDLSDVTTSRGNSTTVQLAAGSAPPAGNCAMYDANGNIVDAGTTCGGGGGGAVSSVFTRTGAVVATARDYYPNQLGCDVVRSSGTVITIFSGASAVLPCILRIGNTSYAFTAAATVTLSAGAGTGTARVYMAVDGTLSVGHNLTNANVTCSGCTKVPATTAYPADSVPIWTWPVSVADTWDSSGSDQRGWLSSGLIPAAGTGILSSDSAGVRTLSIGATVATFGVTAVSFSATPTFTATTVMQTFTITLTNNVTSSTLAGASTGGHVTFKICQDGTGSRTFAWPANFRGATTIGSTASLCTIQEFLFDGTDALAITAGVTNI